MQSFIGLLEITDFFVTLSAWKRVILGVDVLTEGSEMSDQETSKQKKGLRTLAMVNVGIWAVALIALVILLQRGGNLRGMYVILAGGTVVGIQIIAAISKLK